MADITLHPNNEDRKARRKKADAKWYANNRKRANARSAKWYAANRELAKKRTSEWQKNNRERTREIKNKSREKSKATNQDLLLQRERAARIKHNYGITLAEYEAMVASQGNRCDICKTTEPGKRTKHWCIDHCHETKSIRRLLCHHCNLGIGYFKHNTDLLQRAIDYLKLHGEPKPAVE